MAEESCRNRGYEAHAISSEVAPAGQRGKYVVLNHVGFVAGLAAGFW